MIWYIIWKYGLIIGFIYFLYKIIKEKTFLDKFRNFGIVILVTSLLCVSINYIIGYNISIKHLKFVKKETIELVSYPDVEKPIYAYINSYKYNVITKKNNIVEPKTCLSSTTKMKFIKSNKAYIEVYKPVDFKYKWCYWFTNYIPDHHRQYYICIPENTFVIKDE